MVTRLLSIPRSLAFYLVFYLGSIFCVTWAVIAIAISEPVFRNAVHIWSGYHRLCARLFCGIRPALEQPNFKSGVIYAVKHESFYEAIDLPSVFHLPVVFAKAELMRIPMWGLAASRFGLVSVERDAGAKALRTMLSAARSYSATGRPLVIFPEGTRVRRGTDAPLQSGFAGLYKLLNIPVIPVAVDSGPLYHRFWKRPGVVHYSFGEEIPAGLPRDEIEARVKSAINALSSNG